MKSYFKNFKFSLELIIYSLVIFSYIPVNTFLFKVRYFQGALQQSLVQKIIFYLLVFLLCVFFGLFFEFVFRKQIFHRILKRSTYRIGFVSHLFVVNVIWILPFTYLVTFLGHQDIVSFVIHENLIQIFWLFLYWKYLSFAKAGIFHGIYSFIEYFVIRETGSGIPAMVLYSSGEKMIYHTQILATLIGVTLIYASLNKVQKKII